MSEQKQAIPLLNAETITAMQELENGDGEVFSGSTEDFFNMLLEEE